MLVTTVIPIFLVIFGAFLAFKTRNVMFLWNEAREISFGPLVSCLWYEQDQAISTIFNDTKRVVFHFNIATSSFSGCSL